MFHFDVLWLFICIIRFTGLFYPPKKTISFLSSFSPPRGCRKPSLKIPRAESLTTPARGEKKTTQKPTAKKVMSCWLPHPSVRHQPWHWCSQATHLPEESRARQGHHQPGNCHCLSVALTSCNNGRRRSNKSGAGGRWPSVGLLKELSEGAAR